MYRCLATALAAAMLLSPVATQGADVALSGDVLYRFMYDNWNNTDAGGNVTKAGDFQNRYWWNLRWRVTATENLSFLARLSNPEGYFTSPVPGNLGWAGLGAVYNLVSIPEMYFKWTNNPVTLSAGFIPVAPAGTFNTVMDLVAVEAPAGGPFVGGYAMAGIMPWFVATNGSQAGMNLALSLVQSDALTLGLDVVGAMADDGINLATGSRGRSEPGDVFKADQYRFIVSVPVSIMSGMVSILPVLHTRTNVYRTPDLEEGNHSLTGGIDVTAKPIDMLFVRLGYAIGGYRNDRLADIGDTPQTAPLGMLFNAGVSLRPGFGRAAIDFARGSWTDREIEDGVVASMLYWDILYDIPIASLTVRPRVRIWSTQNDADDARNVQTRPEINFMARF